MYIRAIPLIKIWHRQHEEHMILIYRWTTLCPLGSPLPGPQILLGFWFWSYVTLTSLVPKPHSSVPWDRVWEQDYKLWPSCVVSTESRWDSTGSSASRPLFWMDNIGAPLYPLSVELACTNCTFQDILSLFQEDMRVSLTVGTRKH